MAVSKDVFIPNDPNNRKEGIWVRFDQSGNLVKGENYYNGGWYYFDTTTGAMVKGVKHISSNGGKWVYYDVVTGKMAHGEAYLHYDKKREHTGWYYLISTPARWPMISYTSDRPTSGVLRQDHRPRRSPLLLRPVHRRAVQQAADRQPIGIIRTHLFQPAPRLPGRIGGERRPHLPVRPVHVVCLVRLPCRRPGRIPLRWSQDRLASPHFDWYNSRGRVSSTRR